MGKAISKDRYIKKPSDKNSVSYEKEIRMQRLGNYAMCARHGVSPTVGRR